MALRISPLLPSWPAGEFLGIAVVALQPIYTLEQDDRARLRPAAIDRNCTLDAVPPRRRCPMAVTQACPCIGWTPMSWANGSVPSEALANTAMIAVVVWQRANQSRPQDN